jgi:hypothetical protein
MYSDNITDYYYYFCESKHYILSPIFSNNILGWKDKKGGKKVYFKDPLIFIFYKTKALNFTCTTNSPFNDIKAT